jgi:hypothetical protein
MTRHTTLGQLEREQKRRPYRYGLVEPEPRRLPWWVGFVAELVVLLFAVAGVIALMAVVG